MTDRYRAAADVAWVEAGDGGQAPSVLAWAAVLPDGAPMTLQGPAWVVWAAITEAGEDGDILAGIGDRVQQLVGRAVPADDVELFVGELVGAGLVTTRVDQRSNGAA